MFTTIIESLKKHSSIKESFIAWCRIELGIKKQQENIDTLYYLLNEYVDIKALPKTKNRDLRLLQLCDTEIMHIFDKICEKNGLTYWMYGGTLLGAYRHGGFIPWDDDTDLCMPREDFNQALQILPELCKSLGIEFTVDNPECPMVRFGIGYKHSQTGVWIDVFPVDHYRTNKTVNDMTKEEFLSISAKVRNYYNSNKTVGGEQAIVEFRNKLLSADDNGKNVIYHDNMEFKHHVPRHYAKNEIFPIRRTKFEDYELCSPNDYNACLTRMYKDYMAFPRSGVAHHGSESGGSIINWAKNNSVDMSIVLKELQNIYNKI